MWRVQPPSYSTWQSSTAFATASSSSASTSSSYPSFDSLLWRLKTFAIAERDDAVQWERVKPMSYDAYQDFSRGSHNITNYTADQVLGLLDEIKKTTVRRVRADALLGVAPEWCQRGIRILLGETRKAPLPLVPKDIADDNLRRRGPPPEYITKEGIAAAIQALAAKGEKTPELYEPWPDRQKVSSATCSCGSFFVEKKAVEGKILLRTILDARRANAKMDASSQLCKQRGIYFPSFHFPLITLEQLRTLIGGMPALSTDGKYYVINVDFRHYYHQLPLADSLKPYFTMKVKPDKKPEEWYVPRALPMGWILAPYIAQSCTWAMLLGKHDRLQDNKKLDVDATKIEALPAWVPLKRGGGIVVLMDNVLVITPIKEVAEEWQKRLQDLARNPESDGGGFNVEFKGPVELQTIFKETRDDVNSASACSTSSSPATSSAAAASSSSSASIASKNYFDFLGIRWYYDERELIADDDTPKGLDLEAGTWNGTHRALASIVGKLLWYYRVADRDMFETEMRGFRKLLSRVTPVGAKWDDPVGPLDTECLRALIDGWNLRKRPCRFKNLPDVPLVTPRLAYAAVDASTIAYGAVYWDANIDGPCTEWGSTISERIPHPVDFAYIGLSELAAIIIAVHQLRTRVPEANCLVIATDNATAKNWIENRVAKSAVANQLLEYLFRVILGPVHLRLVYVESAANAADPASREKSIAIDPERAAKTAALLRKVRDALIGPAATRREREPDE